MSCFSCPSTDLITLVSYCVDLALGVLKAEVTVNSGEDGGVRAEESVPTCK